MDQIKTTPMPRLLAGKPRVFVTQETNFDFKDAERFGDVEFLTGQDLLNIKDSGHNARLLREVYRKLRRFDPDRDWLLIAGSPYVAAAAFWMLGRKDGVHKVQILRWSNRDSCYIPLYVDFNSMFTLLA